MGNKNDPRIFEPDRQIYKIILYQEIFNDLVRIFTTESGVTAVRLPCVNPYYSKSFSVFTMISTHSNNCVSFITNGGAKRMMLPCVGFASNPLSRSFKQMFQAVSLSGESLMTMAFKRPFPRTNFSMLLLTAYAFIFSRNNSPSLRAFSARFSS